MTVAPVAHSVEAGNTEGCTPGYWKVKQHHDSWQEAAPSDSLVSKYSAAGLYTSTANMTLLDALKAKGGSGTEGAARILARAAVAAYLNAAYDDEDMDQLKFPWRRFTTGYNGEPPLVETVNAAFASGKRSTMIKLARQLDEANNLGCPLN